MRDLNYELKPVVCRIERSKSRLVILAEADVDELGNNGQSVHDLQHLLLACLPSGKKDS